MNKSVANGSPRKIMSEHLFWLLWHTRTARKQGPAALSQRRRERLAEIVAYARANSPYYRQIYQDLPEWVKKEAAKFIEGVAAMQTMMHRALRLSGVLPYRGGSLHRRARYE